MGEKLDLQQVASLKQEFHRGFVKTCGITLVSLERGRAESRLEISAAHSQQDGFVHAGVMATMADHTAGYASFALVDKKSRILTIEFKINYLRPAVGEILLCRSTVIKEGRQVLVAESEVYDVRHTLERLAAKAMVTLMAVPAEAITAQRTDYRIS